jgi:hypothetical protein
MAETEKAETVTGSLILLHAEDNILICAAPIGAGTRVEIDGSACRVATDIPVGHKVARRPLRAGDKVLRYGIAIGTMTADAAPGDHVHRHNLASDYIPSHDRAVLRAGESEQ